MNSSVCVRSQRRQNRIFGAKHAAQTFDIYLCSLLEKNSCHKIRTSFFMFLTWGDEYRGHSLAEWIPLISSWRVYASMSFGLPLMPHLLNTMTEHIWRVIFVKTKVATDKQSRGEKTVGKLYPLWRCTYTLAFGFCSWSSSPECLKFTSYDQYHEIFFGQFLLIFILPCWNLGYISTIYALFLSNLSATWLAFEENEAMTFWFNFWLWINLNILMTRTLLYAEIDFYSWNIRDINQKKVEFYSKGV